MRDGGNEVSSTGATMTFTVPGRPVPKMRARIDRNKRTGKISGRTPDKTRDFENSVGFHAVAKRPGGWPKYARYAVHIDAHITLTKREKKRRKLDLDNIVKSALDGLNRILWHDDAQVDAVSIRRWTVDREDNECTTVRVTAIPEDET